MIDKKNEIKRLLSGINVDVKVVGEVRIDVVIDNEFIMGLPEPMRYDVLEYVLLRDADEKRKNMAMQ